MTTPLESLPDSVARWISRVAWLRWADALVAWIGLWGALAALLAPILARYAAAVSLACLALGLAIRAVRVRWRPVSGWVGLAVSRTLRPGDRAWYVRSRQADLVVVTARHGARVVIARPDLGADEGLNVRRTRVLLIPADAARVE